MNIDTTIITCFQQSNFKEFQKVVSKKKNQKVINAAIETLFAIRETDKKSWSDCCSFVNKLKEHDAGLQDFDTVNVIASLAANQVNNTKIVDAVTFINSFNKKNSIIISTCEKILNEVQECNFLVSQFISLSTNIVSDKEELITRLFCQLSRNSSETVQKHTYKIIMDKNIFYPIPEINRRIGKIIVLIEENQMIESIKNKDLKDFYLLYKKRFLSVPIVKIIKDEVLHDNSEYLSTRIHSFLSKMQKSLFITSYDACAKATFEKLDVYLICDAYKTRDKKNIKKEISVSQLIALLNAIKSKINDKKIYIEIEEIVSQTILEIARIHMPNGIEEAKKWLEVGSKVEKGSFHEKVILEFEKTLL